MLTKTIIQEYMRIRVYDHRIRIGQEGKVTGVQGYMTRLNNLYKFTREH